jgi:tetratricopeptide (TPR) repeat protein
VTCSIDYYQDSEPFDFNTAHSPDIHTPVTSADYRTNLDPAMRAVSNYNQTSQWIQSLVSEMDKAFAAKGFEEMKQLYLTKKQELTKSGYNLEKFFRKLYENTFSKIKPEDHHSIEYLSLAVNECPESVDLTYYLAYTLEKAGRLHEARQYFNQCLKLNPAHHYAKMKLELLELKKQGQ